MRQQPSGWFLIFRMSGSTNYVDGVPLSPRQWLALLNPVDYVPLIEESKAPSQSATYIESSLYQRLRPLVVALPRQLMEYQIRQRQTNHSPDHRFIAWQGQGTQSNMAASLAPYLNININYSSRRHQKNSMVIQPTKARVSTQQRPKRRISRSLLFMEFDWVADLSATTALDWTCSNGG